MAEILPQPKAKCSARKRQGKKTKVLTGTPNKRLLVEKLKKSNNKTKPVLLKKSKSGKWQCLMCSEPYIKPPTEDWIQCVACKE